MTNEVDPSKKAWTADEDAYTKPVSRAELWILLSKADVMMTALRGMAFAAGHDNKQALLEMREMFIEEERQFTELKDKLIDFRTAE